MTTDAFDPATVLRHRSLALRDFAELLEVEKASITFSGVTVTYTPEHGFRLAADGAVTDITEWVENVGLVPA